MRSPIIAAFIVAVFVTASAQVSADDASAKLKEKDAAQKQSPPATVDKTEELAAKVKQLEADVTRLRSQLAEETARADKAEAKINKRETDEKNTPRHGDTKDEIKLKLEANGMKRRDKAAEVGKDSEIWFVINHPKSLLRIDYDAEGKLDRMTLLSDD